MTLRWIFTKLVILDFNSLQIGQQFKRFGELIKRRKSVLELNYEYKAGDEEVLLEWWGNSKTILRLCDRKSS